MKYLSIMIYYYYFILGDLFDYHFFLSLDSSSSVRQDAAKCLVDLIEVVHLSTFGSKLILRLEQFSFDQNVTLLTLYKFTKKYIFI